MNHTSCGSSKKNNTNCFSHWITDDDSKVNVAVDCDCDSESAVAPTNLVEFPGSFEVHVYFASLSRSAINIVGHDIPVR